MPAYSRREASAPVRRRRRSLSGCWYSQPPHTETPMPEVVSSAWSRRERQVVDIDDSLRRGAPDVGVGRQRETGAQAPAPPRPDLGEKAAHVGGHCPGRASRQGRARNACATRSFSPLRKKARASSRRTRTRSGRSISIARSEAMASSSSASRSSPERSGCCDAPVAARPMRKSTFASTAPPWASGRRMPSASLNRPSLDQGPGLRDGARGGLARGRRRGGRLPRAPCRGGEHEGGGGQDAKEKADRHLCYS